MDFHNRVATQIIIVIARFVVGLAVILDTFVCADGEELFLFHQLTYGQVQTVIADTSVFMKFCSREITALACHNAMPFHGLVRTNHSGRINRINMIDGQYQHFNRVAACQIGRRIEVHTGFRIDTVVPLEHFAFLHIVHVLHRVRIDHIQ